MLIRKLRQMKEKVMQSEQQFQQLMMQYEQLINGAEDIANLIDNENYDSAITLLKSREQIFINCKNIRRYLELTPIQEKQVNSITEKLKELEFNNIKKLEKSMEEVQLELSKAQKSQKLKNAYNNSSDPYGGMINIED